MQSLEAVQDDVERERELAIDIVIAVLPTIRRKREVVFKEQEI